MSRKKKSKLKNRGKIVHRGDWTFFSELNLPGRPVVFENGERGFEPGPPLALAEWEKKMRDLRKLAKGG